MIFCISCSTLGKSSMETPGQLEVVEEPVLDDRPDGVLDRRAVQVPKRLGQHVGGAVAHDEQAVGVAVSDD